LDSLVGKAGSVDLGQRGTPLRRCTRELPARPVRHVKYTFVARLVEAAEVKTMA